MKPGWAAAPVRPPTAVGNLPATSIKRLLGQPSSVDPAAGVVGPMLGAATTTLLFGYPPGALGVIAWAAVAATLGVVWFVGSLITVRYLAHRYTETLKARR